MKMESWHFFFCFIGTIQISFAEVAPAAGNVVVAATLPATNDARPPPAVPVSPAAGSVVAPAVPAAVTRPAKNDAGPPPVSDKGSGVVLSAAAPVSIAASNNTVNAGADLSREGHCKEEVAKLCKDTSQTVFRCIQAAIQSANQIKEKPPLSRPCRKEYRQLFLAKMAAPSHHHAGEFLVECAEDLRKYCTDKQSNKEKMSCLRLLKPGDLEPKCKHRIFDISRSMAGNIFLDQELFKACSKELGKDGPCPRIVGMPGHQVACLRGRRDKLDDTCRRQLFQRDVLDSEDVRLNQDVLHSCRREIKSRCESTAAGEARKLHCLWRTSYVAVVGEEFSQECRVKVRNLTRHSLQDYRLDFGIRSYCAKDIETNCIHEKLRVDALTIAELFRTTTRNGQTFDPEAGQVITCLKLSLRSKQIASMRCKSEVSRAVAVESASFGTDPGVLSLCQKDMAKFCLNVPKSAVHACLRKRISNVERPCREKVTEQAQLEGEDITRNPILASLCKPAISKFCEGVQPGEARVMNCLQDNRNKADFPDQCKKGLLDHLESVNSDWKLKYGISSGCERDVDRLCSSADDVLMCLKTNMLQIQREGCKREVRRYAQQGLTNIRLAPATFQACKQDVDKFCEDVEPGEHRVHDCLWKNRLKISDNCSKLEFDHKRIISVNAALDKRVDAQCGPTVKKFCGTVAEDALWDCLGQHYLDPFVSQGCHKLVRSHMEVKHSSFYLNPKLVKYCHADAVANCGVDKRDKFPRDIAMEGEIISCLLMSRDLVKNERCFSALKETAKERVGNIALTPSNRDNCAADIQKYCPDVKSSGRGEVYKCLQPHLPSLQFMCRESVKQNLALRAEDLDFDSKLRLVCKDAADKLCPNVRSGFLSKSGGKISCLLGQLHHAQINAECTDALVEEQTWRSKYLDLNPGLRRFCEDDLVKLLAKQKCGNTSQVMADGWKLHCLTSNVPLLTKAECKTRVDRYTLRISADIRASFHGLTSCKDDLQILCPGVEFGKGRKTDCLVEKVAQIKNADCKGFVQAHQARIKLSASFNFKVATACKVEQSHFCQDIKVGEGRLLACLGAHMSRSEFGDECRKELDKTDVTKIMKKYPLTAVTSFGERYFVVIMAGVVGFVIAIGVAVSHYLITRTSFGGYYQANPVVVGREYGDE